MTADVKWWSICIRLSHIPQWQSSNCFLSSSNKNMNNQCLVNSCFKRALRDRKRLQRTCNSIILKRRKCARNKRTYREKKESVQPRELRQHGCHSLLLPATTWKRQLRSDNLEATTWKRQLGSDNLEATTWKRQLGSDNLEVTTWKR